MIGGQGYIESSGPKGRVELMTLPAERIVIMSPTDAAEPRVPVTAKLSKRFYDVLGEDIANELVEWFNAVDLAYRTDLRELNELNFARFDAKLEQRLAELRSELLVELRTGMQQVRTEVRTEVQQVRAELRTEIQQVRVELLRWMFGFWVSTLIGIAGLAIALR
jgi:exonuclease VII large subunit